MKLIFLLVLLILLPQLSFADDEVIWETDVIGSMNEVEISPLGEVFYNNSKDSIIQVRNVSDGKLIDEIIFKNTKRLDHISISADGRFMAVSGETKFVIIYDLFEKREVKRITTVAYEREEYEKNVVYNAEEWISSSISPDGTKITGVVIHKDYDKTNFVVIDIESEKVLFEQRRITYDYFNPSPESFKWMSAEFSPDGNYIVAQLDYYRDDNIHGPDSVYIYNAHTMELHDVVLNNYNDSGGDDSHRLTLSSFKPMLNFYNNDHIYLYDIPSKTIIETNLNRSIWGFVFAKKSNHIIYNFEWESHIYDIDKQQSIYKYKTMNGPKVTSIPKETSFDDTKLFSRSSNSSILCLKTFFTTASIKNNSNQNIISPNPTTGILNINLRNQSISQFHYSIVSSSGQIVISNELGILQPKSNNLSIDISSIASGHYILRVFSEREEFTFSIIKEG